MNTPLADPLQGAVEAARQRTLAWLDTMHVGNVPLVSRYSAAHDPAVWPGLLLPGTYNAVCCRALIDTLGTDREALAQTARWLEAFRLENGIFRISGMSDDTVYKRPDLQETWEYIDFHVTNYALGALELIDTERTPNLGFVAPFLKPGALTEWLGRRDWADPWQEGNNLVNLASFLVLLEEHGSAAERAAAAEVLGALIDHLEAAQNPTTAFWGENQNAGGVTLLHAMAGAMHPFHLWYLKARRLPHHDKAIRYVLSLDPRDAMGACLDVDVVDVLFHGPADTSHDGAETAAFMRNKITAILALQNDDGGFPDMTEGTLRFDGWVGGYAEAQGTSNTFATWFRWIALAMASEYLWPGWRDWRFRRMIGIGFAARPEAGQ